jgi:ABC-type transport system involved in multi-copper enzyme maturation permease subunit
MIAKTLALTLRSIREDARLLRTHLFRLFLLAIIVWFLVLTQWDDLGVGAPGLEFFSYVTYLDFFFMTLAGIGFFASAITEEKEEMTLGLLRMAGIGPMALLAGKMLPRLLGAVLLLSVQFPFTLLAITLGGVSLAQVAAAYCTLFTYTLMLAGVALFCSVACRLTKTAALWTSVIIGLFLFVPWWFRNVLGWTATGAITAVIEDTFDVLYQASPMYRLGDIISTGFLMNAKGLDGWAFGFQAMTNSGAAVGFFLLSWLTFNWFNRDERSSSPSRGLILQSSSRLRQLTGGRVWGNALFWKDLQFLSGGPLMVVLKLFLYGLVGGGCPF